MLEPAATNPRTAAAAGLRWRFARRTRIGARDDVQTDTGACALLDRAIPASQSVRHIPDNAIRSGRAGCSRTADKGPLPESYSSPVRTTHRPCQAIVPPAG